VARRHGGKRGEKVSGEKGEVGRKGKWLGVRRGVFDWYVREQTPGWRLKGRWPEEPCVDGEIV
jgi:hypothetical protein